MLSALVVVALHAAPVDVVVVTAPDPARASLKKALAGRTVIDASALYAYLFASGPMPMQDFDAFRAAPVAGWPKPLAATWKDGLAHCRGIAGPPPWKDDEVTAFACATRLSEFLWEKYLEATKADRVILFHGGVDQKKGGLEVTWITYRPDEEDSRHRQHAGTEDEYPAVVDAAVGTLLAGDGFRARRSMVKVLFDEVHVDPFAGEAPVTKAVTLKTSCDGLPKALRVTTPGPLADSVAARWTASTAGSGSARDCGLKLTTHDERMVGSSVTVVSASLTCGDVTTTAESTTQQLGARTPVDILSARLVVHLAARLCAKE